MQWCASLIEGRVWRPDRFGDFHDVKAHGVGRADCARYSTMVADRELRLAGYEVFRFGAEELYGDEVHEVLKKFFEDLFVRRGVLVRTATPSAQ